MEVVQNLFSSIQSLSTGSVVGAGAAVAALIAGASIYDFLTRDSDTQVRAALRSMPSDAFKDQAVWIIGASSGIGEALAYEVSKRGGRLLLSARRIDRLRAVASECVRLGSAQAETLELDVLRFESHQAAAAKAYDIMGQRIDVLINNAGRSQRALVEDCKLSVDQDLFQLNVMGVLSVTKAVLPYMLQQGRGCIANTSSIAGKAGSPGSATYAGTKAAVNAYMNSLRMEVGYRGISVVNVCPGPVTSEITLHAFTGDSVCVLEEVVVVVGKGDLFVFFCLRRRHWRVGRPPTRSSH
jgi:short-subunit dehydrogenase